MADFCRDCTVEIFGPDCRNDFEQPDSEEDKKEGGFLKGSLCEGCGWIITDARGVCLKRDHYGSDMKHLQGEALMRVISIEAIRSDQVLDPKDVP